MKKPTVDISVFTNHTPITINKLPFEIHNRGELPPMVANCAAAAWKQATDMEDVTLTINEGESDEDFIARVKEYDALYMRLMRRFIGLIVIDLPASVRDEVSVSNAVQIASLFFGLPQVALTTGEKPKKAPWRPPTGAKSRLG